MAALGARPKAVYMVFLGIWGTSIPPLGNMGATSDTIGGMGGNDTSDTVATTLRIEKEMYRKIRLLAAEEEKSMAQWIREAIALVIERVERNAR